MVNLIIKYTEFTSLFLVEVQASTVGQVSGNLSICQNNSLTIYNNSQEVYYKYRDLELDEAGNASYAILVSVDNIYTACYFMFFEYYQALQQYVTVLINPDMLLYNLMHNLGSIYDLGEEVYYRILDFEEQGDTV